MPTDKPRFSIVLEPEMSEELEAYWHENRYKSKNAAINDLLRSAFASLEQDTNKSDSLGISPAALDIARQYDQLDVPGQRLVNAVINEESARIAQYGRLDNQYRERVADLLKRIPETPSPLQAAGQGE